MRAKLVLATLTLAAVAVVSCHPVFFWDMQARWEVDGGRSSSVCAKYNIDVFVVRATGPMVRERSFECGAWDTGHKFYELEEGVYRVTVSAVEQGSGKSLAAKTASVEVFQDSLDPDMVDFSFAGADFSGGGGPANIDVYWNINGTVDGQATGTSWDTCAEVGADKAVVSVDGTEHKFDCHSGGNMSGSVKVSEGDHTVSVKLVDKSGADLTTAAKGTVKATKTKAAEFTADFYYFSFITIKTTMKGDYRYATSFGAAKASCGDTTPAVQHTTAKLDDDKGAPVSGQFCGGSSCYKTNGTDLGGCWAKDQAVSIKELTWGLYTLRLQGLVGSGASTEVCWEQQKFTDYKTQPQILVGAGSTNPLRALNLARINSSGACQ